MRLHKCPKGFSLLEIMLIIVIVGVIAVYMATSVRGSAEDRAVAKSATEMQYWLQAASAYYVRNSAWPPSINELYGGTEPYFPKSQVCSPWHIPTASLDPQCAGRGEYAGAPARYEYYWALQVEVPTAEIAMKLASQLHSATVKDGTIVTAYAPKPAATLNTENQLLIKSIYEAPIADDKGIKVALPTDCPPRWKVDYEPTMNRFNQTTVGSVIRSINVMKNVNYKGVPSAPFTFVWLNELSAVDTHSGINTVITFCVPPDYINGNT